MAVPLLCVLGVCILLVCPGACALDNTQEALGHFLRVLNVTGEGPRSGPSAAPPYMLELYRRFSSGHSPALSARTVRSFSNQDRSSVCVVSERIRALRLLFNISVPQRESLVSAELLLHVRVRRPSGWKVTVFDLRLDKPYRTAERHPLASKRSHRQDSGWEVLDMTSAVRQWRKVNIETLRLEVHIESLDAFGNVTNWEYGDLDVDRSPDGKHEPALVIFSDSPTEKSGDQWDNNRSDPIAVDGQRVRRSAKVDYCHKGEMYVNFKDISWDSFILAPSGYQAFTCRGTCLYPLTPEVTPTKHAMVQTLLNLKSPQRTAHACCVPTALEPLSIIYKDKNGVTVLENYEGMVVKECGCR